MRKINFPPEKSDVEISPLADLRLNRGKIIVNTASQLSPICMKTTPPARAVPITIIYVNFVKR